MFFADLKYIRFHIIIFVLQAISAFGLAGSIAVLGFISFQKDYLDITITYAYLFTIVYAHVIHFDRSAEHEGGPVLRADQ